MIMLPVLIITNIKLVTSLSPKKRLNRSVLVTLMERMKSQQLRKLITSPKRTRRSVPVGMKTVRKIHQQSGSIPSLKSQLKSHDTPCTSFWVSFFGSSFRDFSRIVMGLDHLALSGMENCHNLPAQLCFSFH